MAQQAAATVNPEAIAAAVANRESTGINVTFAIFASLAVLFMIFIGLIAVTDYFNVFQINGEDKISVPIVSERVQENLKKIQPGMRGR